MPYSQQKVIQCWYDVPSDMVKTHRHEADATVALTFRVENQVNDLECGGWRGCGAEAFFAEMHEAVLPALHRLEDALEFASEQLAIINRIFRDAERRAAEAIDEVGRMVNRRHLLTFLSESNDGYLDPDWDRLSLDELERLNEQVALSVFALAPSLC